MTFWQVAWLLAFLIVGVFSFVVLFGAPFLPALKPQIKTALDLADLKPGQTLLELGSGDGRVLIAAAERGAYVTGYELNPVLALYSWLRTRKYGDKVRIVWGNYWKKQWPDVDVIYTFLLKPYMQKLDKKITQEVRKPVKLVSVAFRIDGKHIDKEDNGVYLYIYK